VRPGRNEPDPLAAIRPRFTAAGEGHISAEVAPATRRHMAGYLRAQVPGRRCLNCTQICHLCTCLNWLPMTCVGRSPLWGDVGGGAHFPAGIRVGAWPGLLVFLVRAHRARAVAQAPTPVPGSGPGV